MRTTKTKGLLLAMTALAMVVILPASGGGGSPGADAPD